MSAPRRIVATPLHFFSELDEKACFEWLERISAVQGVKGDGTILRIELGKSMSERSLRELLALFYRFGFDMRPLASFRDDARRPWFVKKNGFWFDRVFATREG
jgi:hypothetical protein